MANQLNFMVDIAGKKDNMVNLLAKLAELFFMNILSKHQRGEEGETDELEISDEEEKILEFQNKSNPHDLALASTTIDPGHPPPCQ